ncbi:hypothetical protein BCR34DRAFT_142252 [Clohesyomyces aquaticus]|uniref:CorA-like transporter domain-containing protein n=1 Tax=Clohesyomyces aquaticus TaxID=1231657 RepID=A0A1Y1YLS8_9PLEO|nr:hypothetical protein BCR34DRAFT_142252 [Clohesyomyces aquaticus]
MMATSDDFSTSYLHFINYPENLLQSSTNLYRSTLSAYKQRLDSAESDLCLVDGEDDVAGVFEVPIRDLETSTGKALDKLNVHSPEELTEWLGVVTTPDPENPDQCLVTTRKKDPKCRFIYLYAQHSRDQLKVTRSSLTQILTFHQVMPIFLDFLMAFGSQSDPKDLRFSGFRQQSVMKPSPHRPPTPELGRSGCHFQMCYNLKGVRFAKKFDDRMKHDQWYIEPAAFYHQFDAVSGNTLWIVTKGGIDIQQRYKDLTGSSGRPEDKTFKKLEDGFRSSLSAHLMFCHWSSEDWRWYFRWLEEIIDDESAMAVYGMRGPGYAHKQYRPRDFQDLHFWQDKTSEAVMVLETNVEVIRSLQKFYASLKTHEDLPITLKTDCESDISSFFSSLDGIVDDFNMHISRARLLVKIITDRKELVIQHLQGQIAERGEELNRRLEREAVLMRIVTILTLIYLPATFVSTFFSTDVVTFQNQDGPNGSTNSASFSSLALARWFQVTLPLTALTLFVAWTTYNLSSPTASNTADNDASQWPKIRQLKDRVKDKGRVVNFRPWKSSETRHRLPLHKEPEDP